MIFFNHTIIFKVKALSDTLDDCKKRMEYSTNQYERNQISEILNEAKSDFDGLSRKYANLKPEALALAKRLEKYWEDNKKLISEELSKIFDCDWYGDRQFICLLGIESIPYFDYYNRTITLPISYDFSKGVAELVGYIIKSVLISKLWGSDASFVDLTYSKHNLRWIMADIVADAIVFNSRLDELKILPAYKYYYTLEIDGNNPIDEFRKTYHDMQICDFSKRVLKFVKDNRGVFRQFSNRY